MRIKTALICGLVSFAAYAPLSSCSSIAATGAKDKTAAGPSLQAAESMLKGGDYARSEKAFAALLNGNGTDAMVPRARDMARKLLGYARSLAGQGQNQEAIKQFKKLLALDAAFDLGSGLSADIDKAIHLFEEKTGLNVSSDASAPLRPLKFPATAREFVEKKVSSANDVSSNNTASPVRNTPGLIQRNRISSSSAPYYYRVNQTTLGRHLDRTEEEFLRQQAIAYAEAAYGTNSVELAERYLDLISFYQQEQRFGESQPVLSRLVQLAARLNKTDQKQLAKELIAAASQAAQANNPSTAIELIHPLLSGVPMPDMDDATWSQIDQLCASLARNQRAEESENIYKNILSAAEKSGTIDDTKLATARLKLAQTLETEGKYGPAEELYEMVIPVQERLMLSPANVSGHHNQTDDASFHLAELYLKSNKMEKATAAANTLIAHLGKYDAFLRHDALNRQTIELAAKFADEGNTDTAMQLYNALKMSPDTRRDYYVVQGMKQLALSLIRQNKGELADSLYDARTTKITSRSRQDIDTLISYYSDLAENYLNCDRPQDTLRIFNDKLCPVLAVAGCDNSIMRCEAIANNLQMKSYNEQAIGVFEKLISLSSGKNCTTEPWDLIRLNLHLARAEAALDQKEKTNERIRSAFDLVVPRIPTDVAFAEKPARKFIDSALTGASDKKNQAINFLEMLIQTCQYGPQQQPGYAFSTLASAFESIQDFDTALELYRKATELDSKIHPGQPSWMATRYAALLQRMGKTDEAARIQAELQNVRGHGTVPRF